MFPFASYIYHCALNDVCYVDNKQQRYTLKKREREEMQKMKREVKGKELHSNAHKNVDFFAEAKLIMFRIICLVIVE